MGNTTDNKSVKKPTTIKDKMLMFIVGSAFLAFCVGTWVDPELLSADTSQLTGRKSQSLAFILDLIWSRPVGSLVGFFGLALLWDAITQKVGYLPDGTKSGQDNEEDNTH